MENTTDDVLEDVRVEVHLSSGVELGPTEPTDLDIGTSLDISLSAGGETFETWSAHPEVGVDYDDGEPVESDGY